MQIWISNDYRSVLSNISTASHMYLYYVLAVFAVHWWIIQDIQNKVARSAFVNPPVCSTCIKNSVASVVAELSKYRGNKYIGTLCCGVRSKQSKSVVCVVPGRSDIYWVVLFSLLALFVHRMVYLTGGGIPPSTYLLGPTTIMETRKMKSGLI